MANILIISSEFPPLNSSASRRVYAWGKYLKRLGHDIFILTPQKHYFKEMMSFNVDLSSFHVYENSYLDIRKIIASRFDIKGKLGYGEKPKKKKRRVHQIILKIMIKFFAKRGIMFTCVRIPNFLDLWVLPAALKGKEIIKKHNIEVIISSYPPPSTHIIAYFLKKKFRHLLWIQDYRDLWVLNPIKKGIFLFTQWEKLVELRCLKISDLIITVSEKLKEQLVKKYKGIKVEVIENGYDEEMFTPQEKATDFSISGISMHWEMPPQAVTVGPDRNKSLNGVKERSPLEGVTSYYENRKKRIIYAGSIYREGRNPELLFAGISELLKNNRGKSINLEVIFFGGYDTYSMIEELLEKYPVANIVKYGGFKSVEEINNEIMNADALLFIERDDIENDGILTGKIFEYMYVRKPILCMGVNRGSYTGEFLHKTGLCFLCGNDLEKANSFLLKLLKNDIILKPDEEYITQFSRKKQAGKLNNIITTFLEPVKSKPR